MMMIIKIKIITMSIINQDKIEIMMIIVIMMRMNCNFRYLVEIQKIKMNYQV